MLVELSPISLVGDLIEWLRSRMSQIERRTCTRRLSAHHVMAMLHRNGSEMSGPDMTATDALRAVGAPRDSGHLEPTEIADELEWQAQEHSHEATTRAFGNMSG